MPKCPRLMFTWKLNIYMAKAVPVYGTWEALLSVREDVPIAEPWIQPSCCYLRMRLKLRGRHFTTTPRILATSVPLLAVRFQYAVLQRIALSFTTSHGVKESSALIIIPELKKKKKGLICIHKEIFYACTTDRMKCKVSLNSCWLSYFSVPYFRLYTYISTHSG